MERQNNIVGQRGGVVDEMFVILDFVAIITNQPIYRSKPNEAVLAFENNSDRSARNFLGPVRHVEL